MSEELIPIIADRFKALGDPGRLRLLSQLQGGERSVGELVEATGKTQPNVSQQLSNLFRAGLVASRRDGNRVLYRLIDPYLIRICETVCESLAEREEPVVRARRAMRGTRAEGGRRA